MTGSIDCPYYEYKGKPTLENEHYRLYYDLPIHTDKFVAANRPDMVLHIREKTALLIDVSHPSDHYINKTETVRITKYNSLAVEYKEIYRLNSVEVIPIVITANGLINKNLKKYIEEKVGLYPKVIIPKAQKSVILETCRIVRTVLNSPQH
ncbi:uncharacterized protein LOC142331716 [Lycorma delicatula]|uniref:uncharacterized protein LOC142331716 n=1 Tax=Lycorma delicatula TaxID=130591 RepID=UPI003F514D18